MKKLKYTILLFLLFFTFFLQVARGYDVTASLGNLCEFIGKIQTDESGDTNFCGFNPYLAATFDYPLSPQFILSPEAGFSFPKKGRDENISKMTTFILANAKYRFSMFHLLAGAGLFFTRISGDGGEQELNNGNTTSSFPMPDSTVYSRNFIVNLGAGINFTPKWSADFHTFIFNLLESEDRAYSVAINGTYHFGEF